MRRYLSLMESDFPTELGNTYRSMENSANVYGMNQGERGDWADVARGRRDRRGRRRRSTTSTSTSSAARAASTTATRRRAARSRSCCSAPGIDFAILGPSELCNGDQARRSGNEYIFQMLAMQNIETFDGMGVQKIITQCPHCFNALKNEYPQLGGNYEVIHHSQLLDAARRATAGSRSRARRSKSASRTTTPATSAATTTCTSRRGSVVGSLAGIDLVEMPRNGTKGMCCGAGGARMWMEENTGKKVNTERSRGGARHRRDAHRRRVPVLLRDVRRRREGRRARTRKSRSRTSPRSSSKRSKPASARPHRSPRSSDPASSSGGGRGLAATASWKAGLAGSVAARWRSSGCSAGRAATAGGAISPPTPTVPPIAARHALKRLLAPLPPWIRTGPTNKPRRRDHHRRHVGHVRCRQRERSDGRRQGQGREAQLLPDRRRARGAHPARSSGGVAARDRRGTRHRQPHVHAHQPHQAQRRPDPLRAATHQGPARAVPRPGALHDASDATARRRRRLRRPAATRAS